MHPQRLRSYINYNLMLTLRPTYAASIRATKIATAIDIFLFI